MLPAASLTGKFRLNSTEGKVCKKPRASLACTACRRQKLRCDKVRPCSSCVKRENGDQCVYGQPETTSASIHGLAEERLGHLESMVLTLMQQQQRPDTRSQYPRRVNVLDKPSAQSIDQVTPESDAYVGPTHWSAMLSDIQELKTTLQLAAPSPSSGSLSTSASTKEEVMYGLPRNYSIRQICQQLPPRTDIDRYLSIFFSGETFILPIVHTACFRRQYGEFWDNIDEVNLLWLSLLFSICYMAACIASPATATAPPPTTELHTAAGQCLVLGQYHQPQRYVVEALVLYAQSKNFQSLDPSRQSGAVLGTAVRHAYTMGYHRDPDILGKFTTFQGEMRRRTWATCKQMDLMLSFQLGLPSQIRLENCDTRAPSNLIDSDFDESTKYLPPPRSEEEATRLLWFIVKDRQMVTFSKICQNALSVNNPSEAEVLNLDTEVRQMYSTVPTVLRSRAFEDCMTDSPFLIMTRIYIEFIYLKSLCVLHRRSMIRGTESSITAATLAATSLVERFLSIETELQPGGILEHHQWMVNSFSLNDFLLGMTTLCLSVSSRLRKLDKGFITEQHSDVDGSLSLLGRCLVVCEQRSAVSKDAVKVSQAVGLLLSNSQSRKRCESVIGATLEPVKLGLTNSINNNTAEYEPTDGLPPWLTDPTTFDLVPFYPFDFLTSP